MARMHARKKGKSSSKRPIKKEIPKWFKMKPKEVTDLVLEFFKKDKSMSEIGLILRDQYSVPSVTLVTGKTIKQILKDAGLLAKYPEDLMNLMRKAVNLKKHINLNKKDNHNRRALQLIESKIRRLIKYYKSVKELPMDWYYTPEKAALIIRE